MQSAVATWQLVRRPWANQSSFGLKVEVPPWPLEGGARVREGEA